MDSIVAKRGDDRAQDIVRMPNIKVFSGKSFSFDR